MEQSPELDRELDQAHVRAAALAMLAWSLSGFAWTVSAGPDKLFRLGAPAVGALFTLPALLALFLESGGGRAAGWLLLAAAAILGSFGLACIGSEEPWRLAAAYLVPAAILLGAVVTLAAPAVLPLLELRPGRTASQAG